MEKNNNNNTAEREAGLLALMGSDLAPASLYCGRTPRLPLPSPVVEPINIQTARGPEDLRVPRALMELPRLNNRSFAYI